MKLKILEGELQHIIRPVPPVVVELKAKKFRGASIEQKLLARFESQPEIAKFIDAQGNQIRSVSEQLFNLK